MKSLFPGYYFRSSEDLRSLWSRACFVLDANVLLNLYRYSPVTRENLFRAIGFVEDRLWISYQAASEFHSNRIAEIARQAKKYDNISKDADKLLESLDNTRAHPFVPETALSTMRDSVESLKESLVQAKTTQIQLLRDDDILNRITRLIGEHVGDAPTTDEHSTAISCAEARTAKGTPPGCKDAKKDGDRKYGDAIMWLQILDYAKTNKRDIIFVTDDSKDDWWLSERGETLGPRPELLKEFIDFTGHDFHMYDPTRFIEYATNEMGRSVSQESLEETRAVSARRKARQRTHLVSSAYLDSLHHISITIDHYRYNVIELLEAIRLLPQVQWDSISSRIDMPLVAANRITQCLQDCPILAHIIIQIKRMPMPMWQTSMSEFSRENPDTIHLLHDLRQLPDAALDLAIFFVNTPSAPDLP